MAGFDLLVVTAETEIFRGRVTRVVACSSEGELAIFASHAPLLAILRPGILRVDRRQQPRAEVDTCLEVVVHGGFIEVQANSVIVLADAIERADDIDLARAERAVKLAKSQLGSAEGGKLDLAMARLQLELARYQVACWGHGVEPRIRY